MSHSPIRVWFASRLGFVAVQAMLLVAIWTTLRLGLAIQFGREAASSVSWPGTFLRGFHQDLVVAWILLVPAATFALLTPNRLWSRTWFQWLIYSLNGLTWAVGIFLIFAEYFFFEEFRSRFNTVAIDYLLYPHEVFTNIWDTYPLPFIIVGCVLGSIAILALARKVANQIWQVPIGRRTRWIYQGVICLGAGLLSASLMLPDARPSSERLANEIAGNGFASVATAAWSRNLDYAAFYPSMPRAEAVQRVRSVLEQPGTSFSQSATDAPITRQVAGDPSLPKRNLVILLEESMGSEFWGCLGRQGPSLTPEMDGLAKGEGILFENLYATGNRTVRGMEGVLSGFPPLPGDSIVKRDRSDNVETIARVLKREGYHTVFLYGGRGLFDGMRSYAVNNGFDRFVEQKDFRSPVFETTWGVSDEDLYQRALAELSQLHSTGQPFLATVLSVSNHKPFTYPTGRIAENPLERRRENAVKYCDWALGRFFEAARKQPFWTNTLFAVVADHGARVYGSQTIPIRSYEIPMLLLGPAFVPSPRRISTLGGQVDVPPTLLGLLGRPYRSMFFGRDLLKPAPDDRLVLLNHNRSVGAFRDGRLVVMSLNRKVEYFRGDPKREQMRRMIHPEPGDVELLHDATAIFQIADELYMNQRFTIDASPGSLAIQ